MRVLVTRPQPGADETAARLATLGHEPIVLPLTRTVPVQAPAWREIERHDAIVATSASAIAHIPQPLREAVRTLPLHAVGERTADLARRSGFADVAAPFADADDLVASLP